MADIANQTQLAILLTWPDPYRGSHNQPIDQNRQHSPTLHFMGEETGPGDLLRTTQCVALNPPDGSVLGFPGSLCQMMNADCWKANAAFVMRIILEF